MPLSGVDLIARLGLFVLALFIGALAQTFLFSWLLSWATKELKAGYPRLVILHAASLVLCLGFATLALALAADRFAGIVGFWGYGLAQAVWLTVDVWRFGRRPASGGGGDQTGNGRRVAPLTITLKRVGVILVVCAAIVVLAVLRSSPRESDLADTKPVLLSIGAEQFNIPRDYLVQFFSPSTGPQKVLWIEAHFPELTPAGDGVARTRDVKDLERLLRITVWPQTVRPWVPNETNIYGAPYQTTSARFDLLERRDQNFPLSGSRQYFGMLEGVKVTILCHDPDISPPPRPLIGDCEYDFPLLDLNVTVHFSLPRLADWRDIHRQTVAFLNGFKVE